MTKKYGVDTDEFDKESYNLGIDLQEREELDDLVPDQDYVEHIVDTVKKTVRCEDSLIRQILYTAASKNTADPQNLGILCPTSEGKTYAVTETLAYLPKREVWNIGAMSPKVLVRDHSVLIDAITHEPIGDKLKALKKELRKERRKNKKEIDDDRIIELEDAIQDLYDNSKRLIDLQGMLLVCLEPPHPETWKILKPILSHDDYEIEYPYVDKIEGVGTKTIKIVTRGWPACIFCSAKNESNWPEWPEVQSRFLISSTNMIQEKYFQGNQIISQRYGLPKSVQQTLIVSDRDREIARLCVRQLLKILKEGKEKNQQVWMPYYQYLAESLPAEKGTDNRVANRIFALLSIITQCNAHLRYKLQDDNEILPIADIEHDLAEVLNITHNITGIPTFKMKVFKEVVLEVYNSKIAEDVDPNDPNKRERIKAVTTRQCCDKYKEVIGRSISTDSFKKTYLDEYLANGLIDQEESALNKNRHIYYPIIDVSLYDGHVKHKGQEEEKAMSMKSNLSRFDLCLQQNRLQAPKIHNKIPRSWLELEILFIIQHRIGEDNKAKSVPNVLDGGFSLLDQHDGKVCIHECTDFLNTPSLIRCYSNATFIEDSQEVKENVEYLYKIYPCSCKHKSNQSNFDFKDVKIDTNGEDSEAQYLNLEGLTEEDFRLEPNPVQIININKEPEGCDVYIGRNWPIGLRPHPIAGMSGYLGNPFVKDRDGTREEVIAKYREWLYHGTEVVNGRDPAEYRRMALNELPYHWRWGCHCKPEACHGDILLEWMIEQYNDNGRNKSGGALR